MQKAALILLGLILLLILGIYLYPTPSQTFTEVYTRVDEATAVSLQTFRHEHAPRQLEVDGKTWEYTVFGDGETVLFLHGMTGAYDIWWQVMENLAADYRVMSVTYPPVDSLAGMAEGITAVLDAEQIETVHLVGSSLGGYFTQYLVATYPEMVETAVFANTFPPNEIIAEENKTLGGLLPIIPEWAVMGVLKGSAEESLYPAAGHSELVRAYVLEQAFGRMSKAQFLGRYHAVIDPFTPPDLAALGIPVLIIEADNDPLVAEELREMLKMTYPEAAVHTLHAVGHFPYLNEPEQYTDLLTNFWTIGN
ncbi:MAG: alpha/beta hydrolase [Ardenticatenaceae bacterium]|nr:MAG: alpha/beta hydrolase [Ardenticatenaceae bacterium]